MVPTTSNVSPGAVELIPTLPLKLLLAVPVCVYPPAVAIAPVDNTVNCDAGPMANAPCGAVVPIPTLPPVNNALFVRLLNVGVPVNVLAAVPLCVYPPDVIKPKEDRIVPTTSNVSPGAVEPIPTFPFMITNPPCGVVVPMPTLPLVVAKNVLPLTVNVLNVELPVVKVNPCVTVSVPIVASVK